MTKIAKNKNLEGKRQGRPKGSPNKTTATVKAAIEMAAEGLGGAARLVEWAKQDPKNEAAFWTTIYPKLLPLQIAGDKENPLRVISVHDEDAIGLINKIRADK